MSWVYFQQRLFSKTSCFTLWGKMILLPHLWVNLVFHCNHLWVCHIYHAKFHCYIYNGEIVKPSQVRTWYETENEAAREAFKLNSLRYRGSNYGSIMFGIRYDSVQRYLYSNVFSKERQIPIF